MQNRYLRQHMDLRARLNIPEPSNIPVTGRPPRRITCKYLVPILPTTRTVEVCQKAFVSAFVITTKRVRLQREKLISSLGLNSYSSHNRYVCYFRLRSDFLISGKPKIIHNLPRLNPFHLLGMQQIFSIRFVFVPYFYSFPSSFLIPLFFHNSSQLFQVFSTPVVSSLVLGS